MTNRTIKFRAWDKERNVMLPDSEITRDTNGVWEIWDENDNSKDDNFVLMQFTGLLDKKGKEIYEGDIITKKYEYCEYPRTLEVKWDDYGGFAELYCANEIEVIGNIYEHENLLKN